MDIDSIFENKWVALIVLPTLGAVATLVIQQFLKRRIVFSYFVNHEKVGVSTDDTIFGSVRVSWNGHEVRHLYLSTIELVNESFTDCSDVTITAYTNDAKLLTERTEIVGTTEILQFTERYADEIKVAPGSQPTEQQFKIYNSRRSYLVHTLNRGQVVRLQFLNAADVSAVPNIWLEVVHKGVRLKHRKPQHQTFGVPTHNAVVLGALICSALLLILLAAIKDVRLLRKV